MSASAEAVMSTLYFFGTLEFFQKVACRSGPAFSRVLFGGHEQFGEVAGLKVLFIDPNVEEHGIGFSVYRQDDRSPGGMQMIQDFPGASFQFGDGADILRWADLRHGWPPYGALFGIIYNTLFIMGQEVLTISPTPPASFPPPFPDAKTLPGVPLSGVGLVAVEVCVGQDLVTRLGAVLSADDRLGDFPFQERNDILAIGNIRVVLDVTGAARLMTIIFNPTQGGSFLDYHDGSFFSCHN